MYNDLIKFVQTLYRSEDFIPLHAPTFNEIDREYVLDAIDSTFVSSVGEYVNRFENDLATYTKAVHCVATVNGTTALQTGLRLVGVQFNEEVITQPLTFVATANAISHLGGVPVFVDVDKDTMGLDPGALESFLQENAVIKDDGAYNKKTGRRIAAVVPVHTFGHPCAIKEVVETARCWSIPVVEDGAEAVGSWSNDRHCGTFGDVGVFSFNGNKTITCGGGGAVVTSDEKLARHAKHLTTTAKIDHPWEYDHDEIGYNFRLSNLNAAMACAQMERLPGILKEKRKIAQAYEDFFASQEWCEFIKEPECTTSNYWLCTIALDDAKSRDDFLEKTNAAGVMTRPAWKLMSELSIYSNCQTGSLDNARWLRDRLVCLPSGVRAEK